MECCNDKGARSLFASLSRQRRKTFYGKYRDWNLQMVCPQSSHILLTSLYSDVDDEFDSVVVGLTPSLFTYDHLNTAFRILMSSSPPKPLIATHRARYIRVSADTANPSTAKTNPNDTLSLGPGPFVAALEAAAGVEAQVVGKPSRVFFQTVIESLPEAALSGEDGSRVAIIGDDIETDLGGGALELGLWRVLGKPFMLPISPLLILPTT